jgi:hypothetical protein
LNPGAGRWLVYSTNPALDTRGGLVYDFKQYNATFGVTAVADPGKGFLYTVAPTATPTLTGTAAKVYDATTAATLSAANYTFPGAIDGDTIDLGNSALSGLYNTPDVGTAKLVSVSGLSLAVPVGAHNGTAKVYGYQLTTTSASGNIGTITAAPLTITPNDQAKTYGDAFSSRRRVHVERIAGRTDGWKSYWRARAHRQPRTWPAAHAITASGARITFNPGNYAIDHAAAAHCEPGAGRSPPAIR